jgi:hypothetical protein
MSLFETPSRRTSSLIGTGKDDRSVRVIAKNWIMMSFFCLLWGTSKRNLIHGYEGSCSVETTLI